MGIGEIEMRNFRSVATHGIRSSAHRARGAVYALIGRHASPRGRRSVVIPLGDALKPVADCGGSRRLAPLCALPNGYFSIRFDFAAICHLLGLIRHALIEAPLMDLVSYLHEFRIAHFVERLGGLAPRRPKRQQRYRNYLFHPRPTEQSHDEN